MSVCVYVFYIRACVYAGVSVRVSRIMQISGFPFLVRFNRNVDTLAFSYLQEEDLHGQPHVFIRSTSAGWPRDLLSNETLSC